MYYYKLAVYLCCLINAVGSSGRRMRMKRGTCEYGTFLLEGKTCCMCPSGYRITEGSDCPNPTYTKCELCKSGSFMNHPNNANKCQPCKVCTPNANLEIKEKCTEYSNTVCTCMEHHYCDKGDLCRACYPCNTCEEHGGVKTACTATNNTVCNGVKGSDGKIVAAVLVPLLIIVALLVVFLWRKKKFCFKDKRTYVEKLQVQEPLLKDVNLKPYLQEITSIMKPEVMKNVARRTGMSEINIDQHEKNHPQDVNEQTYQLLLEWSETQGLQKAYLTLIKTLRDLKRNTTADQIKQIVEKGQDTA